MTQLDAVVLQPFGGPERSEDVVPVLDNVLRGRGVPESRKLEVAEHYRELGGTSPANACNRRFSAHVEAELRRRGRPLRLFLGNRNWHPLLPDTLAQMRDCGVGNAAVFVTSSFSSYSGCRQYQGDRERATATVDDAPALLPTAKFFNHPGFIEANADQVRAAIASLPPGPIPTLVCTAHSIPCVMADSSPYVEQLRTTARLLAEAVGLAPAPLAWQSLSGPPDQPWLEPDVCDHVDTLAAQGCDRIVVAPIGFLTDHVEVLFDLDDELRAHCELRKITMARANTAGTHPAMIRLTADLIEEAA